MDSRRLNFALEDTGDRCYRDISNGLLLRGWKKVQHKKRSKLEKKRLPMKDVPLLIWTINEKDIEFSDLQQFQICNHFQGIEQLTTKRGFCELLKDGMQWICADQHEIAPRCYNLGDPLHREEFIEDFRVTALTNVLKWALCVLERDDNSQESASEIRDSGGLQLPVKTLSKWMHFMKTFLRINLGGEWPGVELNGFDCDEIEGPGGISLQCVGSMCGAGEQDWSDILDFSYSLAESRSSSGKSGFRKGFSRIESRRRECGLCRDHLCSHCLDWRLKVTALAISPAATMCPSSPSMIMLRLLLLLKGVSSYVMPRQDRINGNRNVWVVKAPDASCGTGLKLLYRLGDILECERGLGGRTVQKYIESPLLVPRVGGKVDPDNSSVIKDLYGPATALYGKQSAGAATGRIPDCIPTTPASERRTHAETKRGEKDGEKSPVKSGSSPFAHTNPARKHSPHKLTKRGRSGRKVVKRSTLDPPEEVGENVKWYKFDVRVWVLVTSFEPLEAFVFDHVYGRQCGTSMNTGLGDCRIDTLSEHLMHFTNYSIQKKANGAVGGNTHPVPGSNVGTGESVTRSASVQNLRGQVGNMRNVEGDGDGDDDARQTADSFSIPASTTGQASEASPDGRSTYNEALLLSHEEILSIVNAADDIPGADAAPSGRKSVTRWERAVWPSVKRKIAVSLEATRAHPGLRNRPRSFELLGFDVIFDREYEPWILEANLSPAMAHRGAAQSKNIANMAEGLLKLAVLPHVAEEAGKDNNYPFANSTTIGPTITTATGTTFDLNLRKDCDGRSSAFVEELSRMTKNRDGKGTAPSLSPDVERSNNCPHSLPMKSSSDGEKEGTMGQGHWEALPSVVNSPTPLQAPLYTFSSRPEYRVPDTSIIPVKPHQQHSWSVVRAPGHIVYGNRDIAVGEASLSPRGGEGADGLSEALGLTPVEKQAVTTHTAVMPHLRTRHGPTPPTFKRPKSANLTTGGSRTLRPRSAVGYHVPSPSCPDEDTALEIGFALQGRAITARGIDHVDGVCRRFEKIVLLQQWGRRYLHRARLWHVKRRKSAFILQCRVILFLYKCRRWHLARHKAVVKLQTSSRRRLARKRVRLIRRHKSAVVVQSHARRLQASRRTVFLRQNKVATEIQAWARGICVRWRLTMATMLVLCARRWLLWRKRMKRRIFTAVSGYHYDQHKRRCLCQKYILSLIYRRQGRILMQKLRCKRVAEATAAAARARILRLLEARQMAEQREYANFEYCTDIIATETLLSGSTATSLVWDVARSALEQAVFEDDLESQTRREMAAAVEQEERERMDILRKVDDDMTRRLMKKQDLQTQTRQLLCDARGILASRDFRQFQEQLHNELVDKERNSPDAKKLRSQEAADELFGYMDEFDRIQCAKRRGEKVVSLADVEREEKTEAVIFNGRLIHAPSNLLSSSAKRKTRMNLTTIASASGRDTGICEARSTESNSGEEETKRETRSMPDKDTGGKELGHFATETYHWKYTHDTEEQRQLRERVSRSHKREYRPRSPSCEAQAPSAEHREQEDFREEEIRLPKSVAFTKKELLQRQKDQQDRHVERVKRAQHTEEERERKRERQRAESKQLSKQATSRATVQRHIKEATDVYTGSSHPERIVGRRVGEARGGAKLASRGQESESAAQAAKRAEERENDAYTGDDDPCKVDTFAMRIGPGVFGGENARPEFFSSISGRLSTIADSAATSSGESNGALSQGSREISPNNADSDINGGKTFVLRAELSQSSDNLSDVLGSVGDDSGDPRDAFDGKLDASGKGVYIIGGMNDKNNNAGNSEILGEGEGGDSPNMSHKVPNYEDEHDARSLEDAQSEHTGRSDRSLHRQDSEGSSKTTSSASTTALAQFSDTVVRPDGRWDLNLGEGSFVSSEDVFASAFSGHDFSLQSPPDPSWGQTHALNMAALGGKVEKPRKKSQKNTAQKPTRILATAAPAAIGGTQSRPVRPSSATSGRGGAGTGVSSFSSRKSAGAGADEDEQSARRLAGAWMEQQQKDAKKQLQKEKRAVRRTTAKRRPKSQSSSSRLDHGGNIPGAGNVWDGTSFNTFSGSDFGNDACLAPSNRRDGKSRAKWPLNDEEGYEAATNKLLASMLSGLNHL